VGFFYRDEQADADADQPEARDRARIEAGGIPLAAEARLRALGTDSPLFTSGLSVREFALLGRLGPQPLAQVMGASVVRPGWQYLPALAPGQAMLGRSGNYGAPIINGWRGSVYTEPSPSQVRNYLWHNEVVCELDVLTDAWSLARRRALDRLREEALQVGADAVVGVRLHRGDHDLGAGVIEYVVTGTAIRLPGCDRSVWPLLSDLSVQDYWRLLSAGHQPAGLVATTSVVFASAARSVRLRRARTQQRNQELDEVSRAFHAARETVRARLEGQVSDAEGVGAVGVEFAHTVRQEKLSLAASLQSTVRLVPGPTGDPVLRLGPR
jgi:hypothetical protein